MSMATPVVLRRSPYAAFLVAWGRHATGWWGCTTMRVRLVDVEEELRVAAWLPGHALALPNWASTNTSDVRRLVLAADQQRWPAPPRWPHWYAGVWAVGDLPLPPGAAMVTGPAWRKRPPMAPET